MVLLAASNALLVLVVVILVEFGQEDHECEPMYAKHLMKYSRLDGLV